MIFPHRGDRRLREPKSPTWSHTASKVRCKVGSGRQERRAGLEPWVGRRFHPKGPSVPPGPPRTHSQADGPPVPSLDISGSRTPHPERERQASISRDGERMS